MKMRGQPGTEGSEMLRAEKFCSGMSRSRPTCVCGSSGTKDDVSLRYSTQDPEKP